MMIDNSDAGQIGLLVPAPDRPPTPSEVSRSDLMQGPESGTAKLEPDESYIEPIRTSGTRPPLFCVFPGPPGGSESVDILSDDQPIYDLYFSKLSEKAIFPSVEQLAAAFIRDLRKVQPHGPYQLCGYSNAGLLAYEMARSLASEGEGVSFLALIDSWHPEFTRNLPLQELAQYRLMRFLDRIRKYWQFMHTGRFKDFAAGVVQFVSKRANLFVWRLSRFFFRKANRAAPAPMKVVESIVVLQNYSPKAYPHRLILIRPNDHVDRRLRDQTVGWRTCATAGVDVHFVTGEHGMMMNRPYVRAVIDQIEPYLAGVPATGPSSK